VPGATLPGATLPDRLPCRIGRSGAAALISGAAALIQDGRGRLTGADGAPDPGHAADRDIGVITELGSHPGRASGPTVSGDGLRDRRAYHFG
jgi:hypothetical protein